MTAKHGPVRHHRPVWLITVAVVFGLAALAVGVLGVLLAPAAHTDPRAAAPSTAATSGTGPLPLPSIDAPGAWTPTAATRSAAPVTVTAWRTHDVTVPGPVFTAWRTATTTATAIRTTSVTATATRTVTSTTTRTATVTATATATATVTVPAVP